MPEKTFRVGDVFEREGYRWRVDRVFPDGRAVLRSIKTEWATTRALTWDENADGGFRLVERGPA